MCAYLRCVYLVVVVVSVLKFGDCLVPVGNATIIECDPDSCNISCPDGRHPYTWKYMASFKNNWTVLESYKTRNLTLSVDTHGYYLCMDESVKPPIVFYVVGKQVYQVPASSGALTAVIVVAVLFGIGFVIMVALASLKCYRSRASQSLENEVTIREKPQEYDVVSRSVRKSSVDDDGYIIPLNSENSDSDYLEIDCPHMQTPQMAQTCGPLYENLENMRKTANRL